MTNTEDINKNAPIGAMKMPASLSTKVSTPLTPLQAMSKMKSQVYWPNRDKQHLGGGIAAMGERLPDIPLPVKAPEVQEAPAKQAVAALEPIPVVNNEVAPPVIKTPSLPQYTTSGFKAPTMDQIEMPEAPKYKRRSFEERLNAITGGKRITDGAGAIAAMMIDPKIANEDAAQENFEKSIYGKQMTALPQFAQENRARTYAPVEAEQKKSALDVDRYRADLVKSGLGIQQGELDLKQQAAPYKLAIDKAAALNAPTTKEEAMKQNMLADLYKQSANKDLNDEQLAQINEQIRILSQGGLPEYIQETPEVPAVDRFGWWNDKDASPRQRGRYVPAALPKRK